MWVHPLSAIKELFVVLLLFIKVDNVGGDATGFCLKALIKFKLEVKYKLVSR